MSGEANGQLRHRLVIVLVLVMVAAIVAWVTLTRKRAERIEALSPASTLRNDDASSATPPVVHSIVVPKSQSIDTGSATEVCGVGKVRMDRNNPQFLAEWTTDYVGMLAKPAEQRWKAALLASDDYRARAVGLFIQQYVPEGETPALSTEQARSELVQLAVGTGDAAVYAIALKMCETGAHQPLSSEGCNRLSVREWAQKDSGNAAPWLALVRQAQETGDVAAEAMAFRHAASAQRMDEYSTSLLSFAMPQLVGDVSPLERAYAATDLSGYESGFLQPYYRASLTRCTVSSMQQDNIRSECASLAQLMVKHGATLVDLKIGGKIGGRAGWPKERLSDLDEQFMALKQASVIEGDSPWDCSSVAAVNHWFDQVMRLGEVGASREILEQSGHSVPEMAQRYQDHMEKLEQQVQQELQQQESRQAGMSATP